MTMGRLLLVLVALGIAFYLYKNSASSVTRPEIEVSSPVDRARTAAARSQERTDAAEGVRREADSPSAQITENMTPEQVRSLLGAPTEVESEPTDAGGRREKWTYRQVGKTVIFENGVVVSIR